MAKATKNPSKEQLTSALEEMVEVLAITEGDEPLVAPDDLEELKGKIFEAVTIIEEDDEFSAETEKVINWAKENSPLAKEEDDPEEKEEEEVKPTKKSASVKKTPAKKEEEPEDEDEEDEEEEEEKPKAKAPAKGKTPAKTEKAPAKKEKVDKAPKEKKVKIEKEAVYSRIQCVVDVLTKYQGKFVSLEKADTEMHDLFMKKNNLEEDVVKRWFPSTAKSILRRLGWITIKEGMLFVKEGINNK